MAEAREPLTSTYDAFGAARGVEADEGWAFAVSWSLMMADVDVDQVREGLEEALDVVRATGESPQQLFGSASEHADALQDQWVAEGRLVLADRRDRWPELVRFGLGMSVAYAVLLGVVTWVRGDLTGTGVRRAGRADRAHDRHGQQPGCTACGPAGTIDARRASTPWGRTVPGRSS